MLHRMKNANKTLVSPKRFIPNNLTIGFGNPLNLIFLLDRITAYKKSILATIRTNRKTNENQRKAYTRVCDTNIYTVIENNHCIPVRWTLGGINEFISQTFCNSFDISKSSLASTSGKEIDGLINTPQGGNIHSLTPDHTSWSNTSCIFPWSTDWNKNNSERQNYDRLISNTHSDKMQKYWNLPKKAT